MNLKGHLTIGGISSIVLLDHLTNLNFIFKYYQNFINYKFNISLIDYILIFLLLLTGNIFPDLDQLYRNINKNLHYTKYHRQITHSLFLSIGIISLSYYFYINNKNIYYLYLLFFSIGWIGHIISDIFFGKGGIPLLYTKSWNSKYRISIPFFDNEGLIVYLLIFTLFILNSFYIYQLYINNNTFLFYYIVFLIYFYFIFSNLTNSKNIFFSNIIIILLILIYKSYFL